MISRPFRVLGLIKWFQKMLLKHVEASVDSTNELMKILLSIEMIDDAEGIVDRIGLFQHQATHTPRSGFGQSLSSQPDWVCHSTTFRD